MEAVKQGSAAVGLKVRNGLGIALAAAHSDRSPPEQYYVYHIEVDGGHDRRINKERRRLFQLTSVLKFFAVQGTEVAVLATLKRAPSELSAFQRKVFKVNPLIFHNVVQLRWSQRAFDRYVSF